MLNKFLNRMHKGEKGITGLETAIILIAFVVVAAVFAYTALSAGLFATQKSSEAVYSGLQAVQSTIELKGAVIAKAENIGPTGYLSQLTFTLANALGGEPVDFTEPTPADGANHTGLAAANSNNRVVISYIDQNQRVEDLYWTYTPIGSDNGNDILEANEKFQITIGSDASGVGNAGNLVDALNPNLTVNKTFTIEIKSAKGAVLAIQKTTAANIDAVMNMN